MIIYDNNYDDSSNIVVTIYIYEVDELRMNNECPAV